MIRTFRKLRLYFDTLRHLKSKQVFYQISYRIKKKIDKAPAHSSIQHPPKTYLLTLDKSISSVKSFYGDYFVFLNRKKFFGNKIDWNFGDYGKLWTYNLTYFDFLLQEDIDHQEAISLIESFCDQPGQLLDGIEPYPISLRGINWIKYFCHRKVQNPKYNTILLEHYRFLSKNIEYHLLGNHLLENGFSLLFGAYYFQNEKFYKRAEHILRTELHEQVLKDGGHFELSPMYHQILLFRLLDCINLLKNNRWKNDHLLAFLNQKAGSMLSWLNTITFRNGDVPMVNDAAFGIAPTTNSLMGYADRLALDYESSLLSDSGYRMIRSTAYELFIDVGNIGPDYIPGHAHSDTLSFILYTDGRPVIIDRATSTYENGKRRLSERSTESHNTVMVNDLQQSEVWASFRVGKRAKIIRQEESNNKITASHDGYKFVGLTHARSWQWGEREIIIIDEISGKRQDIKSLASIHLHPDVAVRIEKEIIHIGVLQIKCSGQNQLEIGEYDFACGFNKTVKGKVLKIYFSDRLQTILSF